MNLWWTAPGAPEDSGLRAGQDLVVTAPASSIDRIERGVLLDDVLTPDDRTAIDRAAIKRMSDWKRERGAQLSPDGVSVVEIWELELFADVFLPEVKAYIGLERLFAAPQCSSAILHGADPLARTMIGALARSHGMAILDGEPGASPRYPSSAASPRPVPPIRRCIEATFALTGVPHRVRGNALLVPYWHLEPVFTALATRGRCVPIFDFARPQRARPAALVGNLLRGGWIGRPSLRARSRSRRVLNAAILEVDRSTVRTPLEELLEGRALSFLLQRAGETVAEVANLRSALADEHVKIVVLPFDSPADTRVIVAAAKATQVPTLLVQHGYCVEPNDIDKLLADVVAVWSVRDASQLAERRPDGEIVVTGNPGAPRSAARRATADSDVALVLVEYESRLSARMPARIRMDHVRAALEGLAVARPGSDVVIRPHPGDEAPRMYDAVAGGFAGLKVRVDPETPIDELIAGSGLCVGATSTATLQAAVAGVPTVFLNVTGNPAAWPFDGESGVPVAGDAVELAAKIAALVPGAEGRGRADMCEALGVREDAVASVLSLIEPKL